MNKLNIDDQVKIKMLGTAADGVETTVQSMQKWTDGTILYIGAYHQNCPEGGEGYDTTVQFGEGQYEIINHVGNGSTTKCLGEYSITLKIDGLVEVKSQLSEVESFVDRLIEKQKQLKS